MLGQFHNPPNLSMLKVLRLQQEGWELLLLSAHEVPMYAQSRAASLKLKLSLLRWNTRKKRKKKIWGKSAAVLIGSVWWLKTWFIQKQPTPFSLFPELWRQPNSGYPRDISVLSQQAASELQRGNSSPCAGTGRRSQQWPKVSRVSLTGKFWVQKPLLNRMLLDNEWKGHSAEVFPNSVFSWRPLLISD